MRFLFVCGGTGGHINPALAIASRLRELLPESEFLFVGTGRELEKKLIPAEGFPLKCIEITGFSRSISMRGLKQNLRLVKMLSRAARESREILDSFKPDVAVGTGGYVCYPVLKQAAKMGIPTVLHESNAIPGLTTKMLSGRVDHILTAFPGLEKHYKVPQRVQFVGTPVRGSFTGPGKDACRKMLGCDNRPLVVSLWGSLGASGMNEYTADMITRNSRDGRFQHIHSTGGGMAGVEKMQTRLRERGCDRVDPGTDIRPYIENMGHVMQAADLVLCRAGASTIAELTAVGVPSVLIPSPNVTNDHQLKNARAVEASGASVVLEEKDCSGEKLYKTVLELLGDRQRMEEMARCAKKLGVPDSTERIVTLVLDTVQD